MPKIFIDIETIPSGDRPTLDQLSPPGTMSKAETIDKWWADTEAREADLERIYRKRALSYVDGKIIVVAWAMEDEPVRGVTNDNEEALLREFEAKLVESEEYIDKKTCTVIGHNGRAFDFPYLYLRACKYRLPVLMSLFLTPRSYDLKDDTMTMMAFTDRKAMISLKRACAFFDIKAKEGMEGDQVYDEYLAGNSQGILDYCKSDVENMRKLYYALTFGKMGID